MWQHVANHISWSHNQTCFEHHFEQLSTWRGPCIGYHSFRCCRCQVEGKSPYPRISFKTWMLPLWASSTIFYDTIRSSHDRTYLTYHHRSIAMLQKELNDTKLNWKIYTILLIPKKKTHKSVRGTYQPPSRSRGAQAPGKVKTPKVQRSSLQIYPKTTRKATLILEFHKFYGILWAIS